MGIVARLGRLCDPDAFGVVLRHVLEFGIRGFDGREEPHTSPEAFTVHGRRLRLAPDLLTSDARGRIEKQREDDMPAGDQGYSGCMATPESGAAGWHS